MGLLRANLSALHPVEEQKIMLVLDRQAVLQTWQVLQSAFPLKSLARAYELICQGSAEVLRRAQYVACQVFWVYDSLMRESS
jgi:hypothetical protein